MIVRSSSIVDFSPPGITSSTSTFDLFSPELAVTPQIFTTLGVPGVMLTLFCSNLSDPSVPFILRLAVTVPVAAPLGTLITSSDAKSLSLPSETTTKSSSCVGLPIDPLPSLMSTSTGGRGGASTENTVVLLERPLRAMVTVEPMVPMP